MSNIVSLKPPAASAVARVVFPPDEKGVSCLNSELQEQFSLYGKLLGRAPSKPELDRFVRLRRELKLTPESARLLLLNLVRFSKEEAVAAKLIHGQQANLRGVNQVGAAVHRLAEASGRRHRLYLLAFVGVVAMLVLSVFLNLRKTAPATFPIPARDAATFSRAAARDCFEGRGQVMVQDGRAVCLPLDADNRVIGFVQ